MLYRFLLLILTTSIFSNSFAAECSNDSGKVSKKGEPLSLLCSATFRPTGESLFNTFLRDEVGASDAVLPLWPGLIKKGKLPPEHRAIRISLVTFMSKCRSGEAGAVGYSLVAEVGYYGLYAQSLPGVSPIVSVYDKNFGQDKLESGMVSSSENQSPESFELKTKHYLLSCKPYE